MYGKKFAYAHFPFISAVYPEIGGNASPEREISCIGEDLSRREERNI
jgi:hypothetical protein